MRVSRAETLASLIDAVTLHPRDAYVSVDAAVASGARDALTAIVSELDLEFEVKANADTHGQVGVIDAMLQGLHIVFDEFGADYACARATTHVAEATRISADAKLSLTLNDLGLVSFTFFFFEKYHFILILLTICICFVCIINQTPSL